MALRAHTSEAVSPKAVQPKELPPSYLLFDGQWQQMDIHPVITYNIEDSVVKRSDGVELSLTVRYRQSSFHCTLINGSGDTVCSGTYTPDRCITWQNGLVWKRVDDSSAQRCQHSDIGDFIAKQSNAICSSSLKEEGSPNVQALALNNSPEHLPPAITSKSRGQPPSAPTRMSVQSPLATTSKSRGQPPPVQSRKPNVCSHSSVLWATHVSQRSRSPIKAQPKSSNPDRVWVPWKPPAWFYDKRLPSPPRWWTLNCEKNHSNGGDKRTATGRFRAKDRHFSHCSKAEQSGGITGGDFRRTGSTGDEGSTGSTEDWRSQNRATGSIARCLR